jgi:RNA polymerase sigma factor (sigma-70 family)
LPDTEWIERARQGDDRAWEELVQRYQAPAFRLAYLLLGNADDAEDVAQEAFVRAFRSLSRFDAGRPFRPWLLRITANLAHNQRRSAARYLAALERLFRATPREGTVASAPRLDDKEEAQALWQAIRRLKAADREVIYLRYFLELPVDEAAAVLGVAPGTVKSRLNRALGRLRGVVDREFGELHEGREA